MVEMTTPHRPTCRNYKLTADLYKILYVSTISIFSVDKVGIPGKLGICKPLLRTTPRCSVARLVGTSDT